MIVFVSSTFVFFFFIFVSSLNFTLLITNCLFGCLCVSVFVWFQGDMVLRWWWVSISSHISYRISINVCAFSLYFVFLVLFWLLDAGYKAKALRIAISTDTSHIAQSKATTKNNFDRYCLKSFWTCISIWYHLQWTGWFLFFSLPYSVFDFAVRFFVLLARFFVVVVARLSFYNQNEKSIPLWLSVFFSLSVLAQRFTLFKIASIFCSVLFFFYFIYPFFLGVRQHSRFKWNGNKRDRDNGKRLAKKRETSKRTHT